jgi:hypothetical protein
MHALCDVDDRRGCNLLNPKCDWQPLVAGDFVSGGAASVAAPDADGICTGG